MSELKQKIMKRWHSTSRMDPTDFVEGLAQDICALREALNTIWKQNAEESTSAYKTSLMAGEALDSSDSRLENIGVEL